MRATQQKAVEAVETLGPHLDDDFDDPDSDDNSDDPVEISDLLEDITFAIDLLFSLVSALEETYCPDHGDDEMLRATSPSCAVNLDDQGLEDEADGDPASFYRNIIQDKFPSLDTCLVEILARQNWLRRKRLQKLETTAKIQEAEAEKRRNIDPSVFGKDSALGSSIFTFEAPAGAPRMPSMPLKYDNLDSRSETSWGTTHSQVSGRAKIPKPPVPLEEGKDFQCSICFKLLRGVDTMLKWK